MSGHGYACKGKGGQVLRLQPLANCEKGGKPVGCLEKRHDIWITCRKTEKETFPDVVTACSRRFHVYTSPGSRIKFGFGGELFYGELY